jgi:transposase-like protein
MEILPDSGHGDARPRQNHTPAFKAKVAVAAIKGDRTIVQIAEQLDVHPNRITQWKAQLETRSRLLLRMEATLL